jgi:hypothetical protein
MLNTALKTDPVFQQEYATRSEIHYALRISYWRMTQAVRDGKLEVHLIDNKIKVKVQDIIDFFVAQ